MTETIADICIEATQWIDLLPCFFFFAPYVAFQSRGRCVGRLNFFSLPSSFVALACKNSSTANSVSKSIDELDACYTPGE